jgi:NAD+ kinase
MALAILPNTEKPEALEVAVQLGLWAVSEGKTPVLPPVEAQACGRPEWGVEVGEWQGVQLVVVLGGDGTLLAAAKRFARYGYPLVGVNLGRLGFLTQVEVANLYRDVAAFLAGHGEVEERLMIEARVERAGREVSRYLALNDVVVAKGPFARMVRMVTYVGATRVATYSADGIILSTPTGSTAYSLSAGGPIVGPDVDAIIITPICPHSLTSRPLLVGPGQEIRVVVSSPHLETLLTVDGQKGERILPGDEVVASRAPVAARLLRPPGFDFYRVLRNKLASEERDAERAD